MFFSVPNEFNGHGIFIAGVHTFAAKQTFRICYQSIPGFEIICYRNIDRANRFTFLTVITAFGVHDGD